MTDDGRSDDTAAGCPGPALSASLDYELDPAEARQVEQHVDGCADCRTELAGIERVRRVLRELPTESAPTGLADRLIADRHRSNRRGVALASVAASLLVVLSLTVAEPLSRNADANSAIRSRGDSDEMVRLETLDSAPNGNDGDTDESEMSVLDRAHAAGRELLDFLGG